MTDYKFGALLSYNSEPTLLWIEVASTLQIPSFHVVGLAAPEIAEAKERVRSAIEGSGFQFPRRRVIINLSPANVRKQGTGVDLGIALAVISDSLKDHQRKSKKSDRSPNAIHITAWGELGLDGAIKPCGQPKRALYAAWKAKADRFIYSAAESEQVSSMLKLIQETGIFSWEPPVLLAVKSLQEAWEACSHPLTLKPKTISPQELSIPSRRIHTEHLLPLAPNLERLIALASSGHHHILLLGPRGAGKTHALEWLLALCPPPSSKVLLEQMLLREMGSEVRGSEASTPLDSDLPIRRIGSTTKAAALIGSVHAAGLRSGEFSMAHGGMLVADELPEWSRDAREALREPLESGVVTLTRVNGTARLPARFRLAATGNFCPCGGWPQELPFPEPSDDSLKKLRFCECSPLARRNYLLRLSGPILDRIDLVARVIPNPPRDMKHRQCASVLMTELRSRIEIARHQHVKNWGAPAGMLTSSQLESFIKTKPEWNKIPELESAGSLRNRHQLLRIAMSICCWDGDPELLPRHFSEAATYRKLRSSHVSD